jgi:L-lactate utilization protein LutB
MVEIDKTIQALEKNNMKAYFVENKDKARELAMSMIDKKDVIGSGGSVTLDQCGIREEIRKEGYNLLDWFTPGITKEQKQITLKKSLLSDVFITGTSAVTEDGKLVNIDGRGNRAAAMIFGPKKVIVVVGKNKIVKNLDDALKRIKNIACPKNAVRLKKETPCAKTGKCVDCKSTDRMCSYIVIHEWQQEKRINIIIINEDLGY